MCGITGIFAFNEVGRFNMINLARATAALESRGPDFQGIFQEYFLGMGHRRLSIIDTSVKGHQPMSDPTGRYTIVFNGEIYNYRALRNSLQQTGVTFESDSDTEVLLQLYINKGKDCLQELNGFFAFAVYDKQEEFLFLARDRMGIKPLLYYEGEDHFLFASEHKSLLSYGIDKQVDPASLLTYLQLNYVPAPVSMVKGVKKCWPGHYMEVRRKEVKVFPYYQVRKATSVAPTNYEQAKEQIRTLLEQSVASRLVADVPLGAFLSGGIDSSCIVALASRHVEHLRTFSIGYRDAGYFDETSYANEVAKHFGTEHQVFKLTNQDLLQHLDDIVNYIDEPFADSSAIPVYILSRETRKHVTVALSGDGADEMFSGYNKHSALFRTMNKDWKNGLIKGLAPVWKTMPKSRSGKVSNLLRQLERFSTGLNVPPPERYWLWAGFANQVQATALMHPTVRENLNLEAYQELKSDWLRPIPRNNPQLTDYLLADVQLVLPNDMLTKVDLMSMANSLEVRVPFLDHHLVDYVFSLPDEYKLNVQMRKRILQDAFREVLPAKIYNRPKHGFEVPLLSWFRKELKSELEETVFDHDFLEAQQVFDPQEVFKIRKRLFSINPGDAHAKTWALYVFQKWWKRNFSLSQEEQQASSSL